MTKAEHLERLGDEICELSAHIAAATYRWLMLLAEFEASDGWAHWGCRSCAHWLNWRCGLDLRSAREKIRVARSLADLPRVSAAFSRGEISYSKVRAITRIATPETEADLLMFARHGTTQHVEKIVRGYRRCVPGDDEQARYDQRHLDWRYDDDGCVVIRARLAPEEGVLVVQALEKVSDELRAKNRLPDAAGDGSAEPPRDRADALVELCERELAGTKSDVAAGDRYQVLVHVDAVALRGEPGACHIEDGTTLAVESVRRVSCDGSILGVVEDRDGNVLDVGRKTRTIPTAIKRALRARDGGCMFPGCMNRRFVDGHHIRHWSHGGETSLKNLLLLCRFHHRFVHEGGASVRVEVDGRFTFIRPDGQAIKTAALSVDAGSVESRNRELGLVINAQTPVPRWAGESCEYGVAVEGLLRKNGLGDWPQTESGSAEPREPDLVSVR